MRAVFGDTFYWIALTLPGDSAYARAQQITDEIVTTEEVLTEYLTFVCAAPEYMRRTGIHAPRGDRQCRGDVARSRSSDNPAKP